MRREKVYGILSILVAMTIILSVATFINKYMVILNNISNDTINIPYNQKSTYPSLLHIFMDDPLYLIITDRSLILQYADGTIVFHEEFNHITISMIQFYMDTYLYYVDEGYSKLESHDMARRLLVIDIGQKM